MSHPVRLAARAQESWPESSMGRQSGHRLHLFRP